MFKQDIGEESKFFWHWEMPSATGTGLYAEWWEGGKASNLGGKKNHILKNCLTRLQR